MAPLVIPLPSTTPTPPALPVPSTCDIVSGVLLLVISLKTCSCPQRGLTTAAAHNVDLPQQLPTTWTYHSSCPQRGLTTAAAHNMDFTTAAAHNMDFTTAAAHNMDFTTAAAHNMGNIFNLQGSIHLRSLIKM
ncbi:uncharacterized protein [Cherax quadricarinatus]|uniref:uncharacterized protein n=1 Tax=Cherax quadricarinatus TaxID=27406 RepID=UPI00387E3E85